jgi:hypothetical protein
MNSKIKPLRYPDHYPPTDKWKMFFIGVRWLGPDLSFFRELDMQQASRTEDLMQEWGGGLRQVVAEIFSDIFHESLRWKSKVFLPADIFAVISSGPKFDMLENFVIEDAMAAIKKKYQIQIDQSFWDDLEEATFGQVVDRIRMKIEEHKQTITPDTTIPARK